MLIIGELINCTRKKVGAAAAARDVEFFKEIALRQVNAGGTTAAKVHHGCRDVIVPRAYGYHLSNSASSLGLILPAF